MNTQISPREMPVPGAARISRPELSMVAAMGLVFLPWLAVVVATAGIWTSLHFVVYSLLILAVGYGISCAALPAVVRTDCILISPAVGIVAISALGAFWLRRGLPISWVLALWLVLGIAGALGVWHDRVRWSSARTAHGRTLAVISTIVCLVYLLPAARNDAVLRPDGSFNWMYVDTQHFHALAASLKNSEGVPTGPGTATSELRYHFGPYVPAAAISRVTGLDLGDALVRVTRAASLWALLLASFGLGSILSIMATGSAFGGIMSVAGLFFYGSILSLFTNEVSSASYVTGAILFKIPNVEVLADGGPFSHLLLGHSVLHGMIAISSILALCLIHRTHNLALDWRNLVLTTMPALAVGVNSVAALYCVLIVAVILFWGRLAKVRPWFYLLLMLTLFLAAWRIMGFSNAPDAAGAALKSHIAWQWWPLLVFFTAGLGLRVIAFKWVVRPWKEPVALLFLLTVLGLLSFSTFLHLNDENERYGIYFLECMFSIFAFSRLDRDSLRADKRSKLVAEWLNITAMCVFALGAAGVLTAVLFRAVHRHTAIPYFGVKLLLCFLAAVLLVVISKLISRNPVFAKPASVAFAGVLMIGFLAWITPYLNYGLGRMKMNVTLTPGEVHGLERLRGLAGLHERFATNRHAVPSLALRKERSYSYVALSERPVLLEGYIDRGVKSLPWFNDMLHDNDSMFATNDPELLHRIAKIYQVRWLVARPGTDIGVPRPLPSWLVEQSDTGDLKIYRID